MTNKTDIEQQIWDKMTRKFNKDMTKKDLECDHTLEVDSMMDSSDSILNESDRNCKFLKGIDYDITSSDEDLNTIANRNSVFIKD